MLGLLGLAGFAGMSMFLPPMYVPMYLDSLGIKDSLLLSIPVTLSSIAAVFASVGYGYLHGRLGIHGLSAATTLVIGVALLVAGSVSSIPLFTAAIVVQGSMLALIAPNVSATAVAISAPTQHSQAIGLANGVMFGAQLLFPFIASAIRGYVGLVGVFFAFGGVSLAIGVGISSYLRLKRSRPRVTNIPTSVPD
jgi:MFS family permease